MKKILKKLFPNTYERLWWLKWRLIFHTKIALSKDPWGSYHDATKEWQKEPEPFLYTVTPPAHIETILDVGCSAGRNFIPFEGKLKLWGTDVVPQERIRWVKNFKDLTYTQLSVGELTTFLQRGETDLTNTVVLTCGVLMLCSKKEQADFYQACVKSGCQNFMFKEPKPNNTKYAKLNFKLDPLNFTETENSLLGGEKDGSYVYTKFL